MGKKPWQIAAIIGVFLVLLAGVLIVPRLLNGEDPDQPRGTMSEGFGEFQRITVDGKTYIRRQDLTTILLLGVDQRETGDEKGYRQAGQSDFLLLLILDQKEKCVRRLQIDRDVMAEIPILSILGRRSGTRVRQICLAHAFGSSQEEGAALTIEAVEGLLSGAKVDVYASVNLAAIDKFNDLLGGVEVTIEDDFSAQDPAMVPGAKIRLAGHQAEIFVRSRMSVGDGLNVSRMRRQNAFMQSAISLLQERAAQDSGFVHTLLDGMGSDLTTDMSYGRMVNEFNRAYRYRVLPTEYLEGTHTTGDDGHVEFHADPAFIQSWVLEAFYTLP